MRSRTLPHAHPAVPGSLPAGPRTRVAPARGVLLLVLLLLFGASAWAEAPRKAPARPGAPASRPSTAPQSAEKGLYSLLLKQPERLGCRPGARTLAQVYSAIRATHPDDPTESQLFGGVIEEVSQLLQAAGIPTQALASMPRDKTLPDRLARDYGKQVNEGLLWFAMVRGVCKGTGDPHTDFLSPAQFQMMKGSLESEAFVGLGFSLDFDEKTGRLTIVERIEGSPAARSGLLTGDQVTRINDASTQGMTLESAYAALRVPVGGTVYLTVRRPGEDRLRILSVQRLPFQMITVTSAVMNQVGYIRLYSFGTMTAPQVKDALDQFAKRGVKGLVIDLRNNGGGYVKAATAVCGFFLRPDEVVTALVDKNGKRHEMRSGSMARVTMPMVILVNEHSASASEITAGCLRDACGATLVGTKTYGKGSSQIPRELEDHSAFKVTWAYFTTPKGTRIHKQGLEPDVRVEMERRWVGEAGKDVQLQKALEVVGRPGR